MNQTTILKRAIITEKSLKAAARNVFVFEVDLDASKDQVASIIEKTFGVNVIDVRTTVRPGKKMRVGRRRLVKTNSNTKKALVTLKEGQKIDLFEVGEAD